jgi:hypothetical protein
MVCLGIPERIGQCDLIQIVSELESPAIGAPLIARARMGGLVLAGFTTLQLAKYLLQGIFPDGLLALAGHLEFAFLVFLGQVAFGLQVFDEVSNAVVWVGHAVAIVQVGEPAQGFRDVTAGHGHQLQKYVQQVFEGVFLRIIGRHILGKPKSFHSKTIVARCETLDGHVVEN